MPEKKGINLADLISEIIKIKKQSLESQGSLFEETPADNTPAEDHYKEQISADEEWYLNRKTAILQTLSKIFPGNDFRYLKDAEFDASSLHLLKPLIKKKPVKANVRKTKTPVPPLTFYLSLHDIIAELGAAVYRYRKTARMSREMICKLSGVSITMLCMFENGQLRTFNESVAAVLKALDIECDENMNIPPEIFWRNIRSLRKHKRYLAS